MDRAAQRPAGCRSVVDVAGAAVAQAQRRCSRGSSRARARASQPLPRAAPDGAAPADISDGGSKPTECVALREWSVVNAAVRDGLQTVLLRKGGISEKGFAVEAHRFLLFPSYFHADASMLKPGIAEKYAQEMSLDPKSAQRLLLPTVAEVTGHWETLDPGIVDAVQDLHVGTRAFLEARLKWREGKPLTILELKAWRLSTPVELAPRAEHFGCFSWVSLDECKEGWSLEGAVPCVPDGEFRRRQAALREKMSALADTREVAA